MGRTARTRVLRHTATGLLSRADTVAVEEPLEIRVDGDPFSVTMRTPGDDLDLALGYLVCEGVVSGPEDVASARTRDPVPAGGGPAPRGEVVDVRLADHVERPDPALRRAVVTTSACGVCGTTSLHEIERDPCPGLADDPLTVSAEVVGSLPEALREAQRVFDRTGGVHAAGLFTAAGELLCLREDVGRHNAVDKVVGWAMRERLLPLRSHLMQVSGRASFELVQKCAVAGVPVLAAVSAPSSLAVDHARATGLTLIAFNRAGRFSVYSHPHRLTPPPPPPASR